MTIAPRTANIAIAAARGRCYAFFMRIYFLIALVMAAPLSALAQSHSAAPMLVVGEGAPAATLAPAAGAAAPTTAAASVPGAGLPGFPENAITRVGENTTGSHVDVPGSPPSPAAPANPAAAASPTSPANPATPVPPANPTSKLWPRNTVEIFLPPCTGLRPQYVAPCMCVITQLMLQMPHDEFLAKSEAGTIEQDGRLIRIRADCASTPAKKE